jgi:hypothetical protein
VNIREPSCIVLESETVVNKRDIRVTNGMQSLDESDAVEFVGHRWFVIIHLTNSLKATPLQIGPVGEVADDPSERVADVDARSDC